MARKELVDILQQGAVVWNAWRAKHPKEDFNFRLANLSAADLSEANLNFSCFSLANLSHVDLSYTDLSYANLILADLSRAYFSHADLGYTDLSYANLNNANLSETNLSNTNLSYANLSDANLSGTNLNRANLSGANLNRANLSDTNLSNTNLSDADLSHADLSHADLSHADLSRAYSSHANLGKADLNHADLSYANLSGTNLSYADLSYVKLILTNLSGANLSGANLKEADLSGANLREANFSRANLSETSFYGATVGRTVFGCLDLHTVKGLEAIEHVGPSEISTSTLEQSSENIPDIFLRGVGLSNESISYTRMFLQHPIQYYSCFLSYSSTDQEFAERLYADLQQQGIRCWFAPHSLKIGDHFPNRIEEAIRTYEKLVLILSNSSILSEWVEDEVRAALEKEERFKKEQCQERTVLFPIQIDLDIEHAQAQWAAKLRRTRYIGNFTMWKGHDAYLKSFQRLMRDLKTEPRTPPGEDH